MRIFKTYEFEAAGICKFKDMFDLVEKILQSNNWAYENLLFSFNSSVTGEGEKILSRIPELKDYFSVSELNSPGPFEISNYKSQCKGTNSSEHFQKADSKLIRQVVRGIPRPFNTAFNTVIFNDINWFGKQARHMQSNDKISLWITEIESSHIAIRKEFDYGNKFNPVTIKIEVTDSANGILDDTGIVEVFTKVFGKCTSSNMTFVIEESEKEEYRDKDAKAAKITEEVACRFWDKENFKPIDSGILPHHLVWDNRSDLKHMNEYGNMPTMSPKSAILKIFKSTGYRYVGCENGYYTISRIDDYNNLILLGIDMAPTCRRMSADIMYKGLGFRYRMTLCQYTPDDQAGVVAFIENVYAAVKYLEQHYFPKIQEIYGKTPTWFCMSDSLF